MCKVVEFSNFLELSQNSAEKWDNADIVAIIIEHFLYDVVGSTIVLPCKVFFCINEAHILIVALFEDIEYAHLDKATNTLAGCLISSTFRPRTCRV